VIVSNQDVSVYGELERSPGQEGVYDELMKDVQEHGVKFGSRGIYRASYYALYKGTTTEGTMAEGAPWRRRRRRNEISPARAAGGEGEWPPGWWSSWPGRGSLSMR
jgi:hypothetical protein